MDRSLFKFIIKNSKKQQLFLLSIIVLSYPVGFLVLDLPKTIIDRAIGGGGGGPPYSANLLGVEVPFSGGQVGFLAALCFAFMATVVVNNGLKFYINVYKGKLSERLLRRLRYDLFSHVLRFPLPHFKRTSQGELISMITGEAEQVGAFTAGAIADPALLGGQLVVAIGFIFVQDWRLALAALALYPIQIYVIPKLQKKVSVLAKRRLREVRHLSGHVGEAVSGIAEVHTNDTAWLELSRFTDRLTTIFNIRYELFRRKYTIKFLNNFIDKLAPFIFYLIGGILVIQGNLTLGALVAVIAAHKEMSAPWKELLTWYQQRADANVKYDQIVTQFDPPGIMDRDLQLDDAEDQKPLEGDLELRNVTLIDEDEVQRVTNVSFKMGLDQHYAVVGSGASGKEELGLLLARLVAPSRGSIRIGGQNLSKLPEAVTGRRIGYVGSSSPLQSGTVRENLLYGLKHRPLRAPDYDEDAKQLWERDLTEAKLTGNAVFNYAADWVDYEAAGAANSDEIFDKIIEVLEAVDLANDVYQMGLRGTIDPVVRPAIAESILSARRALKGRLQDEPYRELVELFDREAYNTNATVAENLLFGNPVGEGFDMSRLAENDYVLHVLDKVGLRDRLLVIGRQIAETMVEIFADLPPGHEFFEQYSFISSDDLPEFQALLAQADRDTVEGLEDEDRAKFLSLPFKTVPAQHRLGMIDEEVQGKLLEARRVFADDLPADLKGAVEFFDPEKYNRAASLQDNILFGKLVYGQAQSSQSVGALISETLDQLGLRGSVLSAGLDFQVGVVGSRLSTVQRQKLAIARSLLKQPDLLILNEATSVLDPAAQTEFVSRVLKLRQNRGVVWMLNRPALAEHFHRVVVMREGRSTENGPFAELNNNGGALTDLLKSAA